MYTGISRSVIRVTSREQGTFSRFRRLPESATRGEDDMPGKNAHARQELGFMQARCACKLSRDPEYSLNLTNDCEDFSLAWPPRVDKV
jgi:hypothetical protein